MSSSQEIYGDDFGAERMWGLKELPLPDTVGIWPLAPGWYVVAVAILLLLVYWSWRRYRAWKRNAYRRDAIATVNTMVSDSAALQRLPFLLRRTALMAYPRADVASLRGKEWIAWLNGTAGRDVFVAGDADTFDSFSYAPMPSDPGKSEQQRIIDGARHWIRHHRAAV